MNFESQRRYRTYLLVLVYLIVMMEGIASGVWTSGLPLGREILYRLALALVLTQACIVDSRIVGKPLPLTTYWLVFMLYGIAVPYCVVLARGVRGLVYVAAHFVGIVLSFALSYLVASLIFGTF
jgi:hypothetical protein